MLKYQEVSRDFHQLVAELHEIVPEEFIMLDEQAVEVVYHNKAMGLGCSADCKMKLSKTQLVLNTIKHDDTFWAMIEWKDLTHTKTTDKEYIFKLKDGSELTIIP